MTAVFNLTEAGEHPYCGDGLEESSGFPYLPETFMREGSEPPILTYSAAVLARIDEGLDFGLAFVLCLCLQRRR